MADRQQWLFEQFAEKLAATAESMLGSAVKATLDAEALIPDDLFSGDPDATEGAPEVLVWEQSFDVGEGCRMVVGVTAPTWEKIGGEALKAAGVDELDRDSVRGTYLEILSQTLSSVGSEIGSLLGRSVSAVGGREIPNGKASLTHAVQLSLTDGPVNLYLGAEASLVAILTVAPAAVDSGAPNRSSDEAGSQASASDRATRAAADERQEMLDGSKTLDLLLDVELPVSVSFGRASVPLKDVLKLTSGSIVELNRGVTDPVELIVNNCVIARGEVVVVEGNYGVRIQQIVSARERLRTLN